MKIELKSFGAETKLQMASLIDVVFLLLIYFMVTASLIRQEGELGFKIPSLGTVLADTPIEVFIEIQPDGAVAMDGILFGGGDESLSGMSRQLRGLRAVAASQGAEFSVNLVPHKKSKHGRIVDVMDACAEAGVENLGFAQFI